MIPAREVNWPEVRRRVQAAGAWFVDIPRTGSTSLKHRLAERFGPLFDKGDPRFAQRPSPLRDHTPAQDLRHRLGLALWKSLFTFTLVRNPWDRMVSLYRFRRDIARDLPHPIEFREYVKLFETPSFRYFPPCTPFIYHGYYFSACDYLLDEQGNQLVTYVGRYERRDEACRELSAHLGFDLVDTGVHLSTDERRHYSTYYDEESRAIVERFFRHDIHRFGYEFERS